MRTERYVLFIGVRRGRILTFVLLVSPQIRLGPDILGSGAEWPDARE
jgi:hypothetical protein